MLHRPMRWLFYVIPAIRVCTLYSQTAGIEAWFSSVYYVTKNITIQCFTRPNPLTLFVYIVFHKVKTHLQAQTVQAIAVGHQHNHQVSHPSSIIHKHYVTPWSLIGTLI